MKNKQRLADFFASAQLYPCLSVVGQFLHHDQEIRFHHPRIFLANHSNSIEQYAHGKV
jgi:hypothetical protein